MKGLYVTVDGSGHLTARETSPELEELRKQVDKAIVDIGVMILALRRADEADQYVPTPLRAHIRVLEDEWFHQPTPEGAERRATLEGLES